MDKSVIFVVISLVVVVLIYSPRSSVFAANPRDACDKYPGSKCKCVNFPEHLSAVCCSYASSGNIISCERCDINTDTGDYENCKEVRKPPTTGLANPPQGGGALEQPPTPKKHGNTALPKGGGVLEQPSTDQGTIQSPPTNNKLKGSDLLGQIGGGDSTSNKKGTNNDNSPTPPPCPNKGPIPPNCTLKPKF